MTRAIADYGPAVLVSRLCGSLLGREESVVQYGEAAVVSWARAKGISEKEIEKARQCLK
jgi:hypothetical protein